ncbi:MAG: YicC/YloC family endoribonuclease [Bryobacteraceae bacterium]
MNVRSMTGFARARKAGEVGEVVVSVKSVNHRALDMHFHMPVEFDAFEPALRAVVKRHALRGHIQIQVAFTRSSAAPPVGVNSELLDAYLAAFRHIAEQKGLSGQPDLNVALSLPGMFQEETPDDPDEAIEHLLTDAAGEAMQALNAFREREGRELADDLIERAALVRDCAAKMEEIRSLALPAFQARLTERLSELLQSTSLEPQRLAQEAAVLADRSDIGEELTRLKIHAGQVDELLTKGGEVGKKLDFLLQEMNRETNTILSKSGGIGEQGLGITELALAARAEIEKIREQSLNLE